MEKPFEPCHLVQQFVRDQGFSTTSIKGSHIDRYFFVLVENPVDADPEYIELDFGLATRVTVWDLRDHGYWRYDLNSPNSLEAIVDRIRQLVRK